METNKAAFRIERMRWGGKPAIALVVRNATPAMFDMLDSLGINPVDDIANLRRKICMTPAELDAARNPLAALVTGRDGEWAILEVK